MADDDTDAATAAAAAEAEAAAAKAEADAAAAKAKEGAGDDEPWDKERGMATIRKLRDELKDARKSGAKVAELEQRLQEIEDAEKTELEKAQAKVAAFEAKEQQRANERRETALKLAVHEKAAELGIKSPTLALAALDRNTLEWSDAGEPANLDDQLTLLLEREPVLKGEPAKPVPPRLDGGGGGGTPEPTALTAEELDAAKKLGMTPEKYAAYKNVSTPDEYQALRAREKQAAGT